LLGETQFCYSSLRGWEFYEGVSRAGSDTHSPAVLPGDIWYVLSFTHHWLLLIIAGPSFHNSHLWIKAWCNSMLCQHQRRRVSLCDGHDPCQRPFSTHWYVCSLAGFICNLILPSQMTSGCATTHCFSQCEAPSAPRCPPPTSSCIDVLHRCYSMHSCFCDYNSGDETLSLRPNLYPYFCTKCR